MMEQNEKEEHDRIKKNVENINNHLTIAISQVIELFWKKLSEESIFENEENMEAGEKMEQKEKFQCFVDKYIHEAMKDIITKETAFSYTMKYSLPTLHTAFNEAFHKLLPQLMVQIQIVLKSVKGKGEGGGERERERERIDYDKIDDITHRFFEEL